MGQYRGVFRRLAGVGVIMLAIDVAGITVLSDSGRSTTFVNDGGKFIAVSPPTEPSGESTQIMAIAQLVIGVGIGVALFAWGDSARRKLEQENRDAQARDRNPPTATA